MSMLTDKIKTNLIDINNQLNFFSTVIKGFIYDISNDLYLRNSKIDHFILNSGDDIMYLENKGLDMSIEPLEISNEDFIYNKVPRGIVEVGGMNLVGDQLTNPYTRGNFELEYEDMIYSLSAEFRRVPINMSINIKYVLDSYTDALSVILKLINKLAFIRTFKVLYMGKVITCSYKLQESFDVEKNILIDGGTTDSKYKNISMDFEIETNFPVYEPRTVMDCGCIIKTSVHELSVNNKDKTIYNIIN